MIFLYNIVFLLVFIIPYVQMATVCFYEDLLDKVKEENTTTVEEAIPQE